MSEESMEPAPSQPAESLTWFDTWIQAVTRPSVATFERIVRDPKASTTRAFLWVFITSLIGYAFIMAGQMAFGGSTGAAMLGGRSNLGGGEALMIFLCQTPIMAVLSIVGLVISAGITTLIARALGGSGTFSQLVYAFAAYQAPLALVSGVLGAIPFVIFLSFFLGFYGIVLNVIAVKAVHRFGWGRAIVSSVVILFGILVLIAVVTIAILALMGPAIQNVFNNVIQQIGTPMP
ncbi:MAG: YIP1 family protein [Anaerolineaceae bacterium]